MLLKRHLVSFLVRILYKSTSPQPIATSAAGVYEKQSLILLKMHALPFSAQRTKKLMTTTSPQPFLPELQNNPSENASGSFFGTED